MSRLLRHGQRFLRLINRFFRIRLQRSAFPAHIQGVPEKNAQVLHIINTDQFAVESRNK